MKKFEGFLFCTDLDGTLLGSDNKISAENINAIRYFQSEGGLFTFVTGRMPESARGIYEVVRPNALVGCIDGKGIYDFCNNRYVWTMELPKEARALARYVIQSLPEIDVRVHTFDRVCFCRGNSAIGQIGKCNVVREYDEISEPIAKIVFEDENATHIDAFQRLLDEHSMSEQFDFIRLERTLYEIHPKGVGKGTVLLKLAKDLNIDMGKTIAVGDYKNDVSMIGSAGIGYAVANACEAAKRSADRITVSNDEHAIARIIEELGG